MKKFTKILLLNLMLLPVIWNSIGLLHYMVEHTHTFCLDDAPEHFHPSSKDCLSICQLTDYQPNQQLPTTNEYHELKPCLTSNLFFNTLYLYPTKQTNFIDPHSLESYFFNDIFHPPIS